MLLFCIYASGNSQNVLNAGKSSRSKKINSVGLLGRNGGIICRETYIAVPVGITAGIQEVAHSYTLHFLCGMSEEKLASSGKRTWGHGIQHFYTVFGPALPQGRRLLSWIIVRFGLTFDYLFPLRSEAQRAIPSCMENTFTFRNRTFAPAEITLGQQMTAEHQEEALGLIEAVLPWMVLD